MNVEQVEDMQMNEISSDDFDTREPASPKAVLEELFMLLEDYGPVWYTEEHRNSILTALTAAH
jgi:hypothetical protein